MKRISILFATLFLLVPFGYRTQAQCDGTVCSITIQCTDDYGDGWEGSLNVYQGSSLVTNVTLPSGSYGEYTVAVCSSDSVRLEWSGSDIYNENHFTVLNGDGTVVVNNAWGYNYSNGQTVTTFAVVCPTCPMPTSITASSVTSTSATISWTEPGSASVWYYQYGTFPSPLGTWQETYYTDIDLSGLNNNTMYYFFVYSDCGAGDTSSVCSFTFRTDCGHTVLPITEGFEDNGNDIPFCWQTYETCTYESYGYDYSFPEVAGNTYYNYGYNSPSALVLMATADEGSGVMSPQMPVAANEIEVLLWMKGEDAVQVGYVTTDDTNNAVFHLVGTAGPTQQTGSGYYTTYEWEQFSVNFANVTPTDSIWVVIRRAPSLATDYIYVDDITIRNLNNCADPTGFAVDVSEPTSGQIVLTWNDSTGSAWEIGYGPVGFDPDMMETPQMAYASPAIIEGLDDQITYDFYLRTVCGTQHSYWVGPVSGHPNIYSVTANVDTITTCGMTIVDNGGIDGNFFNNTNQIIVLQPESSGQSVRIQGFAHLYSSYPSYFEWSNRMRIFAGSDTNGALLLNINSTNEDNIDLTSEVGPMTIWFKSSNYADDCSEGFQFHISCEEQANCTTPYNLTVSDITGTTANVSWEYNTVLGEADGFLLYVTDLNADVTTEYVLDGNARSQLLTDLNNRTHYLVRLALDCEGIDTIETSFFTVCSVGGDIQIGSGTATSSYLPAYGYYFGLSQQLFTSTELEGNDSIWGFMVYRTNSAASTKQWDVYMDTTSQLSYNTMSDYVTPNSNRRYFSGQVEMHQGWIEINFDSVFVVPEGKNITLTVYDHTGSYGSSYFRVTNSTDQMSVYGYNFAGLNPLDNEPFADLSSSSTATLSKRNTIKFITPCASTDCVPPTLTAATPDTHSVMLEWVPGSYESDWQVEYRRSDTNEWTMATSSVNDTNYEVTGLDAATMYVFRVSSVCSDTIVGHTIVATTLCDKFSLPFTEDFEWFTATSSNPEIELCWFRDGGYYSSYYPYAYNSSYYAHNGNWSMFFSSYADKPRLVLPGFDMQTDSLNVEFYAMYSYSYNSTPKIEVGVCTDPTDTTTYTVVKAIELESDETEYEFISVDLDTYNGPDGRIFIRSAEDNQTNFYIDDLTVSHIPSCRNLTSVTMDNYTDSDATLLIADEFNRTSYTILWGTTDDVQYATDSMTVTNDSASISGLTPSTTYYAWVRANCGGGDYSHYLAVTPFTTLCSPIAVTEDNIWFNDFENSTMDCMWQIPDAKRIYWQNTVADYTGAHPYSGGHMLHFGSSNDAETMLILPTFDFTGMSGNAELNFYHQSFTNLSYTSYPASTLEVYYRTSLSGNWTLVATIDTTASNMWKKRIVQLPASQGTAIYQVALKGRTLGNSYGIYIDDITVKGLTTCVQPQNVTVSDVTERTATVHWTGTSSAYKVQYRSEHNWNWNGRTVEDVDSCVISPLDMATAYEVRVIALCGTFEQSEPSDVVAFSTEFCSDRIEFDNFTTDATDASTTALMNLNRYYSYSEVLIDSATLAGMSNINGMSFYVDNTYGTDDVPICNIYMGHTSASSLSTFQFDTSFVMVYNNSITLTNGWNRVMLSTPFEWDGQHNVIVGLWTNNVNYYDDSVLYGAHIATGNRLYTAYYNSNFIPGQANLLPSGYKTASSTVPDLKLIGCNPVCYEPVISNIETTENSISVTWYNENATVQVAIKLASENNWGLPVTVETGNSYTFTSLPGMTDFDIRVRRDCTADETDYSDWVTVAARTDTACSIPLDLALTNVMGASATFAWTDGATIGGQWEIHVWNSHFSAYYDVNTNPATIDGLTVGESYRAAVRARCGSNNHVYGEFSDDITFDNRCHPVTNLQAAVNGTSVNLTWTPGERNTQWLVSYGYRGFEPNDMLGYMIVNSPNATITDLGTSSTLPGAKGVEDNTYAFRVRAICGESWNSEWSDEITATLEGIDETETNNRITLNPNPATELVTLALDGFESQATVTIFSIDGREISQTTTSDSQLPFDVSQWVAGTYFVHVQTAGWTAVRKLIVK